MSSNGPNGNGESTQSSSEIVDRILDKLNVFENTIIEFNGKVDKLNGNIEAICGEIEKLADNNSLLNRTVSDLVKFRETMMIKDSWDATAAQVVLSDLKADLQDIKEKLENYHADCLRTDNIVRNLVCVKNKLEEEVSGEEPSPIIPGII